MVYERIANAKTIDSWKPSYTLFPSGTHGPPGFLVEVVLNSDPRGQMSCGGQMSFYLPASESATPGMDNELLERN